MLFSIGAVSLVLVGIPDTTWPITTGAVSGLLCAFLFGLIQAAVAMVGVMRISTPFRGTMAVLIPTIFVALLSYLPISLDLQVIPMVLTYGIGFASLVTALACRWHFGEELIARGNRVLRSSSPTGEAGLVVFMLLFCWAQYKHLGGWYATNAGPQVLGWAMVLSISTAWGFIALSRFGERRRAYALAIPTGVVALFGLYVKFRMDGAWLMPWNGFLAFAVMAPVGWCVSQELAARLLAVCGWRWRPIRKSRDSGRQFSAAENRRGRIRLAEQGWVCIAQLFLVAVAVCTLSLLAKKLLSSPYNLQWQYALLSVSGLSLGVGWASMSSIIVLVAHQRGTLVSECIFAAVVLFSLTVITTSKLNYNVFESSGLRLDGVLIAVAVAIAIHLLVLVVDQISDVTHGNVDQFREHIGIRSLLVLTLVIGLEFALLRFANVNIVVIGSLTLLFASVVALLLFRVYFIGFSWQTAWVSMGLLLLVVFGWPYYQPYLGSELVIGFFVYAAALIAIARWLRRQGYRKVTISHARL